MGLASHQSKRLFTFFSSCYHRIGPHHSEVIRTQTFFVASLCWRAVFMTPLASLFLDSVAFCEPGDSHFRGVSARERQPTVPWPGGLVQCGATDNIRMAMIKSFWSPR